MAETLAQLKTQAVGEWDMVGDCFFSRESLYDMSWGDFELQDKRLACASFGGPIAVIRDERRIVLLTHGSSVISPGAGGLKPLLRTFTSAGAPLGACVWDGGRLVEWGWTEEQQLAVLEASGKVTLFSPFAEKIQEFSFGAAVEQAGVAAGKVYGSGVVAITEPKTSPAAATSAQPSSAAFEPGEVWVVANLRDPKPTRLKLPQKEAYRAAAATTTTASSPGAVVVAGSGKGGGAGGASSCRSLGLSGLGRPGLPQCMAVVDPRFTLSRGMEVLVVVGGSLWQLDEASATDHYPPALQAAGGALYLEVSPDGSFVALYTRDNRLLVLASDMTRQLTEFETHGSDSPPTGLHWVGSDAVLLTWPDTAVLVGPYGDSVQWSFPEDLVAVVSELDGCRLLIGRSSQQLLRRVADCCVQVFRPGATSPAAQLWDARALYDDQNPRCDRLLRNIKDCSPSGLSSAVATCIQAAGHDMNPQRQRALMNAAAYGRPFCPPDFPRQFMYGIACRLRVLAAVRDPRVGLPLTLTQLEALSLPVMVSRLIAYRQWLLAYRIAEQLKNIPGGVHAGHAAPTASLAVGGGGGGGGCSSGSVGFFSPVGREQVLVQWACAKISAVASSSASSNAGSGVGAGTRPAADDEQLKHDIETKLKICPQVPYAPLAAHALAVGRRRLALRLLDEERSAAHQVPLLLLLAVGPQTGSRGGQAGLAGPPSASGGGGGTAEDEDSPERVMERALKKAVASGDTDLVYLVLFGLYRALSLSEFWNLVSHYPLARNLFVKYCRAKEPGLLETVLTTHVTITAASPPAASSDSRDFLPSAAASELATLHLRAALAADKQQRRQIRAGAGTSGSGAETVVTKLTAALADVAQKYGQVRECAFQSKAVGEMGTLLREQVRLERETGQRLFVGLCLADTLKTAIRLGHHRAATALKKQFAVTDRRFTWIKVRTLAAARDWETLEAFAAERRSPIGWEPFVEAAKTWNAPLDYTARLVSRLPDSPAKAEEYSALGMAKEAAEVAARIKDSDLFARIQSAVAAGSPAALSIAQIKERFQSTFR